MENSKLQTCKRKCFSLVCLKQKLPILQWLPKYQLSYLYNDIVAGITVALMLLPQALAYAHVATLHPQYGLYSSFMGCFVYLFLGTSKDITLGPTALMSLLTAEFCHMAGSASYIYATVLCLITGCVQLSLGLIRLGIIVEFISHPVISGFTTSAAIIIAWGQVKYLFGLHNIPRDFISSIVATFENIGKTNVADFGLGSACLLVLVLLRYVKIPHEDGESLLQKVCRTFLFFVTTGKNAVIAVAASLVAYSLLSVGNNSLTLTEKVKGGFPPFHVPRFQIDNGTEVFVNAKQIFSDIGAGFFIVPLMGLVEAIAIGQVFARENSYRLDANQELTAIGVSNILGSFFSAYPVTGSFSRTAVNSQSGSRSPISGLITGALVLVAMVALTGMFRYIPQAALGAIIIVAVLQMTDFGLLLIIWRIRKRDVLPWIATFVGSLILGVQYGIIIGVGVSFVMLLYNYARLSIARNDSSLGSKLSGRDLLFPAAEFLETRLHEELLELKEPYYVLDLSHVASIDFSIAHTLAIVSQDFEKHDKKLLLIVPHEGVREVLRQCNEGIQLFCSVEDTVLCAPGAQNLFGETTRLLSTIIPPHNSAAAVISISS